MTNFISTDKQISTAGWINCISKGASLDSNYQKQFDNDGEIREGWFKDEYD